MPSKEWRDKICGSEDVEATGYEAASKTVQSGEDPWDLRLVDGEVGGGGAVFALCDEDVVAVGWCQFFCG